MHQRLCEHDCQLCWGPLSTLEPTAATQGCTEGVGWGNAVKTSQCTSHIAAPQKAPLTSSRSTQLPQHTCVVSPPLHIDYTTSWNTSHHTHLTTPSPNVKPEGDPMSTVYCTTITTHSQSATHIHTSAWQSSSAVNLHNVMMKLSMMLMRVGASDQLQYMQHTTQDPLPTEGTARFTPSSVQTLVRQQVPVREHVLAQCQDQQSTPDGVQQTHLPPLNTTPTNKGVVPHTGDCGQATTSSSPHHPKHTAHCVRPR